MTTLRTATLLTPSACDGHCHGHTSSCRTTIPPASADPSPLHDPQLQQATLNRELGLTPSDTRFIAAHQDHPLVQAFLKFYTAYCTYPSHLAMMFLTMTMADIRKLIRDTALRPAPLPIPRP